MVFFFKGVFFCLFCFVFNFIYLFIYLWLCWVFVSVWGLSLVVASGGHPSSRCGGLSLSRPLLLRSTGSRHAGSVVVAHGPSCSVACGIFPDQGSNPCPLHWQADCQPLCHQGSPRIGFWKDKIDNLLARLTKKKRERTQTKSEVKRNITNDTGEIQRFIGSYYEQLYMNKLDNLEKNEWIPRNTQTTETNLWRNRKSKKTYIK